MSTNKQIGDYLLSFEKRDEKLRAEAREAGVDLDHPKWRDWPTWIGDPERYLNELRNEIFGAKNPVGKGSGEPPCQHNEMVPSGDPVRVWKCAKCGYLYGKDDATTPRAE